MPVLLTLLGLALDATAQEASARIEEDGAGDGRSWMVLPGAFYSQETSVGFAVYGSATFPIRGTGEETWPSTVSAAVVYTLENQASVAVWPTLYLGRDDDWVASGTYIASHYPTRYYGIGAASTDAWQDFTRRWVLTETSLLRRVHGPFYAGPAHALSVTGVQDVGDPVHAGDGPPQVGPDPLGVGAVPGEAGGVVHGLGVRARHERRDNAQSTRSGTYVDATALGHDGAIGSDYGFTAVSVDLRAFHTLPGDWTLAAQWLTGLQLGSVPFTHMNELGGDEVLRGMYQGRFRDHGGSAVQAELRFPIVWRFRGVAFGGVGQVFRRPADLAENPLRWTAGGGLRYELDAQSHSTIRLDVGAGPDGSGFILNFGEAF